MATALDLLPVDRLDLSLEVADSIADLPALDLLVRLPGAPRATSSALSLLGPDLALAWRQVREREVEGRGAKGRRTWRAGRRGVYQEIKRREIRDRVSDLQRSRRSTGSKSSAVAA